DEPDAVAHGAPRRGHPRGRKASNATLRRPEHGFHLAEALGQHAECAGFPQQLLQATSLVDPQTKTRRVEQLRTGEDAAQDRAADRLFRWIDRLGDSPRRLDDGAVLDARRAGRLARPTVQASVDMCPEVGVVRADFAFVDLTDLVDAATG